VKLLDASLGSALRVVILGYAVAILYAIWMARELTIAGLTRDPLFATYSIAVLCYVLGRFALALFYRPAKDSGYRPRVSVIIPAFNEEDGILGTIESIVRADYPPERVEVVVVNDGSTDGTWSQIVAAKARWPRVRAVDLNANYGKRAAMAEGIRRSDGDVLVFVDSDSYLRADALVHLVAPFTDDRVGGVVGHAEVKNRQATWITKMQQVRYYAAFRIIKGTESLLSGTVICASGCCAAYRRDVLTPFLHDWEVQTFLGRPATFGDDRALTNRVLQTHRVVYQSTAAPRRLRRTRCADSCASSCDGRSRGCASRCTSCATSGARTRWRRCSPTPASAFPSSRRSSSSTPCGPEWPVAPEPSGSTPWGPTRWQSCTRSTTPSCDATGSGSTG
jgi:hyaluronan synthase